MELKPKPTTGRPSTIRSVWIATTLAVIAEKSMKALAMLDRIGATMSRMAVMRMVVRGVWVREGSDLKAAAIGGKVGLHK